MRRILIVEDDPGVRNLLTVALTRMDWQVFTAEDHKEALALSNALPFEVILLDVLLTETSGFAVARQLRDSQAACAVVFMSGYPVAHLRAALGADADCLAVLQKPFKMSELLRRVETLAVPRETGSLPCFA